MVLSAAIGAGIAAAGSIAGTAMSNSASSKMMRQQAALNYHYAKQSALNSPTWNRTGLEKAGYNPMLAVQNATSGSNSSWSGLNSGEGPDLSGAISAGVANAQSFQHLQNETDNVQAQADLAYANADKAKVEKSTLLEKLPYISQRERTEINNLDKDSLLKESQIHNIDETTRFIEKRYELDRMLGLMGIDTQRYGIDKNFKSNIYNADTLAETQRGMVTNHLPFGIGNSSYYTPYERELMGFGKRSK